MKSLVLAASLTLALAAPAVALADEPPGGGGRPKAEPSRITGSSDEPPSLPAPAATAAPAEPVTLQATTPSSASNPDQSSGGEPRLDLVRVNAGFKIGYVTSGAFDTFATNDVLAQFSVDGTYPLLTRGRVVLGAGLGWDYGGRSDSIRGFSSELTVHRMTVPIEARVHLVPGLYGFAKAAPGAAAMISSVTEGSAPKTLETTSWAFAADASLGASILLGPRQHMDKRTVRFWLTPEAGYAFTTTAQIRPNPGRESEDVLGSDENTALRSLALSGFFWRATVGASF